MKKVLILSLGPCHGDNSDTLRDKLLRGAIKAGGGTEKIFFHNKATHYCTGCSTCSLYGKSCSQEDDAAEVIGKVLATDVIIMNTSVHFYTMSTQMKALIDRCCS